MNSLIDEVHTVIYLEANLPRCHLHDRTSGKSVAALRLCKD